MQNQRSQGNNSQSQYHKSTLWRLGCRRVSSSYTPRPKQMKTNALLAHNLPRGCGSIETFSLPPLITLVRIIKLLLLLFKLLVVRVEIFLNARVTLYRFLYRRRVCPILTVLGLSVDAKSVTFFAGGLPDTVKANVIGQGPGTHVGRCNSGFCGSLVRDICLG